MFISFKARSTAADQTSQTSQTPQTSQTARAHARPVDNISQDCRQIRRDFRYTSRQLAKRGFPRLHLEPAHPSRKRKDDESITYKSEFDYHHARLAQVGVNDHNAFRDIVRAEDRRRNRELSARQDAARQMEKSAAQNKSKNGIIPTVKKNASVVANQIVLSLTASEKGKPCTIRSTSG